MGALSPILFIKKNAKNLSRTLLNFYFLYGVSVLLAFMIYNVQRLSPFLHFVDEKNKTFVLTFSEFLQSPFSQVFGNLPLIPYYVFSESSYILPILGIAGLIIL